MQLLLAIPFQLHTPDWLLIDHPRGRFVGCRKQTVAGKNISQPCRVFISKTSKPQSYLSAEAQHPNDPDHLTSHGFVFQALIPPHHLHPNELDLTHCIHIFPYSSPMFFFLLFNFKKRRMVRPRKTFFRWSCPVGLQRSGFFFVQCFTPIWLAPW